MNKMNSCDLCGSESFAEFTVKSKHLKWVLSEDLQKLDTHKNKWLTKNICEDCFKKIFGKPEEDEFSELKKAYEEGKTIQHMNLDGEWIDCDMPVSFVSNHSYRIKPEDNIIKREESPCGECIDSDREIDCGKCDIQKELEQNTGENCTEVDVLSVSGSISERHYATSCLICGEGVPIRYPGDGPRICNECRRAVLAIRKQYKIRNVKLPEEE